MLNQTALKELSKKMIKTICKIIIILIFVCNFSIFNVFAYKTSSGIKPYFYITIKINNDIIKTDTDPYLSNGRVFVPVRFVAEALNMSVTYESEEKKVVIIDKGKKIELWDSDNIIAIDGESYQIDVSVKIINGRTMVPLRVVSENFGVDVNWDRTLQSVLLYRDDIEVPLSYIDERHYSDQDLIWLSRIVSIETGWQSFDAKLGVANVVLNRVKTSIFPDTIYDVIFDTNYTVQFPTAFYDGFNELVPNTESIVAAKMALEGINNVDNCLFFNYVPFKSKSIEDLFAIFDGEYFYY